MAILVTGGKGFIGARVIKNLVERGEEVVCLEPKTSPGRLGELAGKITMVEGDIVNYNDIAEAIDKYKVDKIAHMVFYMAEERGVSERPENAMGLYRQMMIMNTGTFHMFEAARLAGVKKLVYPSSVAYHGTDKPWTHPEPVNEDSPAEPTNLYGMGKLLCEHLAHEYNRLLKTDIVTVRIPGVYGPGVKIGARGVNLIGTEGALGHDVNFPYSSKQHIVLSHVDDIAEMVVQILFAPKLPHEVYHVGGPYVSYGDMGEIGRKLIPGMQVTFNETAPVMTSYRIDNSRMMKEIGVQHRSPEDGYFELINLTRKENGLPPIINK
jgi:UDP-glucose 4-epimerase